MCFLFEGCYSIRIIARLARLTWLESELALGRHCGLWLLAIAIIIYYMHVLIHDGWDKCMIFEKTAQVARFACLLMICFCFNKFVITAWRMVFVRCFWSFGTEEEVIFLWLIIFYRTIWILSGYVSVYPTMVGYWCWAIYML